MHKLRPFLTALLGLTLWVQGFAIAAAPVAVTADAAGTAMEMPCHGDAAADTVPCDCCQGGCVDMAGCFVGQLFAAAPTVPAPPAAGSQAARAPRGWSAKTAILPLPLRPPITSHA